MSKKNSHEKESHEAAREALREVIDNPQRPAEHEEHLLLYLRGIVYHDEREEAEEREKADRGWEDRRRRGSGWRAAPLKSCDVHGKAASV